MIFVLDNYDSFTYNLVHMLVRTGQRIIVKRNRDVTPGDVLAMDPQAIVLSPGPGRPQGAGCLCIRWPKHWTFSFNSHHSNEYSELISFRMDWLDFLSVQGTLKSLLQHHSLKASLLWHSAFQFSHP